LVLCRRLQIYDLDFILWSVRPWPWRPLALALYCLALALTLLALLTSLIHTGDKVKRTFDDRQQSTSLPICSRFWQLLTLSPVCTGLMGATCNPQCLPKFHREEWSCSWGKKQLGHSWSGWLQCCWANTHLRQQTNKRTDKQMDTAVA